jgi:hypothetical protein
MKITQISPLCRWKISPEMFHVFPFPHATILNFFLGFLGQARHIEQEVLTVLSYLHITSADIVLGLDSDRQRKKGDAW